ncbi:hypothetical protein MTO96_031245 [Rhipicephalus appendiculatus]
MIAPFRFAGSQREAVRFLDLLAPSATFLLRSCNTLPSDTPDSTSTPACLGESEPSGPEIWQPGIRNAAEQRLQAPPFSMEMPRAIRLPPRPRAFLNAPKASAPILLCASPLGKSSNWLVTAIAGIIKYKTFASRPIVTIAPWPRQITARSERRRQADGPTVAHISHAVSEGRLALATESAVYMAGLLDTRARSEDIPLAVAEQEDAAVPSLTQMAG